jgi:hypothetical protein
MIDYNMSLSVVTYNSLVESINSVLQTGATPNLCLFTDVEGNVPYTDKNGNVYESDSVSSVNYTQPHNNADGTAVIDGFITISFRDGTVITVTDNVDTLYYSIVAVPFKPRTFN